MHEREKNIRYSSRTRLATNMIRERHEVRHAINELYKLVPPEFARTPQAKRLLDHGCITAIDIVQLIYRPDEPQGSLKGLRVQPSTMQLRSQQGLANARPTLQASPWLAAIPSELGVRVFDAIHDVQRGRGRD
jgi:NTE family protein